MTHSQSVNITTTIPPTTAGVIHLKRILGGSYTLGGLWVIRASVPRHTIPSLYFAILGRMQISQSSISETSRLYYPPHAAQLLLNLSL